MEISYGLVNLMYFMLCDGTKGIKGSRSNKRRKLLTCFTNSLFKVYNNLSLRETGPEVYNTCSVARRSKLLVRRYLFPLGRALADPGGAASVSPPNRINFFHFRICFHQKVYASEVGAPPPTGRPPPNGKSWIRHWRGYH